MTVKEYNNFVTKCHDSIVFIRNLRDIPKKFSTSTNVASIDAISEYVVSKIVSEFDILGFDKNMENLIVKAIIEYCETKKIEIDK